MSRGHTVVYAMVDEPALRARVEAEGHSFAPLPPSLAEQREIVGTGMRKDPTLAGIFGPLAPPAVGPLVKLIAEVEARLVVHDMASLQRRWRRSSPGYPASTSGSGRRSRRCPGRGKAHGTAMGTMGPAVRRVGRDVPPGLFRPLPALARQSRPFAWYAPLFLSASAAGPLGTDDALGLPRPPWVWVTLGTVFNRDRDVWDRLVGELAGLDLQVLVTLGGGAEPSPLMRSPRNVAVRTFVPAGVALAGARAVLCHGGAGTLLGALRHGLPVVCWPQGADQFHNARTCEAAGAGIAVADAVGAVSGLQAVLADARYRYAARRLRDELKRCLLQPNAQVCWRILSSGSSPRARRVAGCGRGL